jgi:hypothetical protein
VSVNEDDGAEDDDEQLENVTCDGCNMDTTLLSFLTPDEHDFCEECFVSRGLEGVEQSNGVTIVKVKKKQQKQKQKQKQKPKKKAKTSSKKVLGTVN